MAASCQYIDKKNMKKFEWIPTESAPKEYPVQIHRGSFECVNGSIVNIPSGATMHNGWGNLGSIHIVGKDVKYVPKILRIEWLSFVENQFYQGEFQLPTEQIVELVKEGYTNGKNEHTTYRTINVGMAPGGNLSVWLMGHDKHKEIAFFKANPTDVSMKVFNPSGIQDRNYYVQSTLEEYGLQAASDDQNVEYAKWRALYRQEYLYKPVLSFSSEFGVMKNISEEKYNGEYYFISADNPKLSQFKKNTLPHKIEISWQDKKENTYGGRINFNEEEIYAAFDSISEANEVPIELKLQVGKYNDSISIFLENGERSIELIKSAVKVYTYSD